MGNVGSISENPTDKKRRGRPRKDELYGGHIRAAEDQIANQLPRFIDNLMRLADGVTVQEEDANGQVRIYSRPPDRASNEYLVNRIMGKPTETREISGPDGEAIPISGISEDLTLALKAFGYVGPGEIVGTAEPSTLCNTGEQGSVADSGSQTPPAPEREAT